MSQVKDEIGYAAVTLGSGSSKPLLCLHGSSGVATKSEAAALIVSTVVRQNSVRVHFQQLGSLLFKGRLRYEPSMFSIIAPLTGTMLRVFRTRRNLLLENLVLRQQLTELKRKRPRPRIAALDKLFWVLARRFWSGWKVVRWHRSGFEFYWRVISRARRVTGRRRISKEVRDLIFRMVIENPA
jgi:hypothetical protein